MVILISGTGGVGKTTLANKLMNELSIPYFSVDHLMMGIFRSNPNCGFSPMSSDSVINSILWPIVREMVKTNIENSHSIIIEGFQILPENINDFSKEYLAEIIPVFIILSEHYILNNYKEMVNNRNGVEKREDDMDSKELMVFKNKELIKKCQDNKIKYYLFCSEYEIEMENVSQFIQTKVKIKLMEN